MPHAWNVTPSRAMAIQRELARQVEIHALPGNVRRVAGLDAAFSRDGASCIAGVVVWDLEDRLVVEQLAVSRPLRFPYVPGLLSFREGPALIAALRRLRTRPDALMVDGHGLAHPRRCGIASHLGVVTGIPSVGCAKSRLCGTHDEPGSRRGCRTPLLEGREEIGRVLRTRDGVRPVYASVGHLATIEEACDLILRCGAGYRLPEPTRLADQLVARVKRS